MFNWKLFFILIAICIPGILFIIPTTKVIYKSVRQQLQTKKRNLTETRFIIISVFQTLIVVAIAAAFGTAINYRIGLHAPFFKALSGNQNIWIELQPQLLPSFITGIGGVMLFLMAYYLIFRPHLDNQTIKCMENLRTSVGIFGRVFYGGIVEEVLCRWGLMAFFVWIGVLLFGVPKPFIYWGGILISGILFGMGHLPAYLFFGCKKSFNFISTVIGLNLLASIIFGWLFWHYGLCAAMIAHALFHITWYPFDLYFATK